MRDLVLEGRCTFADLSKLTIARFADAPADWREAKGWIPASHDEALAFQFG